MHRCTCRVRGLVAVDGGHDMTPDTKVTIAAGVILVLACVIAYAAI